MLNPTHSLTHSLAHPPTHPPTHPLTCPAKGLSNKSVYLPLSLLSLTLQFNLCLIGEKKWLGACLCDGTVDTEGGGSTGRLHERGVSGVHRWHCRARRPAPTVQWRAHSRRHAGPRLWHDQPTSTQYVVLWLERLVCDPILFVFPWAVESSPLQFLALA